MKRAGSPLSSSPPAIAAGFPPLVQEQVGRTVRQEPTQHGLARSRWRRVDLQQVLPVLANYSLSAIGKLLRRLGLRLKRGRLSLHSPDPAYTAKVARIARALTLARTHPARVTLIYGDESSFYRQPTLAQRWGIIGTEPTTPLSHRSNPRHRLCGGLDAVTGRVVWRSSSKIGVTALKKFLRELRAAYPARYLFLVWDNWPVHAHAAVLAEARRQRIHLLWLPTYAPWENPIEKLWRWLKHEHLHHHRLAERWTELKARVATFLDQFQSGSPALLRYVGLWAH